MRDDFITLAVHENYRNNSSFVGNVLHYFLRSETCYRKKQLPIVQVQRVLIALENSGIFALCRSSRVPVLKNPTDRFRF